MNKFFEFIKKLSHLFIVVFGIAIVGVMIYSGYLATTFKPKNSVGVVSTKNAITKERISLRLGALQNVYGTKHHFVKLQSRNRGRSYSDKTHNIIFFRGDKLEQSWLFPHHDAIVLSLSQITFGKNDNRSEENDNKTTQALFYEYIEKDTNKDNILDNQDDLSIAISRPSGAGFKILDTNIKSIIGRIPNKNDNIVTVLMHQGQKVMLKKYSLETFEKINEQELTNISKPS